MKAYRREIMDALPVRPDWHRYMIVHRRRGGVHGHRDPGAAVSAPRRPVEVRPVAHSGRRARHARRSGSSSASARSRCCCSACSAPALFALGVLAGIVALLVLRRSAASASAPLLDAHRDLPHPRQRVLRDRPARRADRRPARRAARAAPSARRAEAPRRVATSVLPSTATPVRRFRAPSCGSCAGPSSLAVSSARHSGRCAASCPPCATSPRSVHPRWGLVALASRRRPADLRAAHRELAARARGARRAARRADAARDLVRLQPRALAPGRVLAARRDDAR